MDTNRTSANANNAPAHHNAAPAQQHAAFTPVDQLHNEIDRIFGDFFGGFFSPWSTFMGASPRSGEKGPEMLVPHMDVAVTDTEYKAPVELPGVPQDKVSIEVRDNMLVVQGEQKDESEDNDEKKGY